MQENQCQNMKVTIRKFEREDIPDKVKWINDPKNNTYLHYDLPLEIHKTEEWFEKIKDRTDRYDAVIEVNAVAVGLIGLLSIDNKARKAEYYVVIGDRNYLGKGVAEKATRLLLSYAFLHLGLNRVYLYTECGNLAAIRSYERIGFKLEGLIKNDLFSKGRYVDRYIYSILKKDYFSYADSLIHKANVLENNDLYIKREDLIPFSFGGNKARKARLFFEEIDRGEYDSVVTYGTSSSNHCRVIANMAAARGMKSHIVSPEESSKETYNSILMDCFGAEITVCSASAVHDTLESKMQTLKEQGSRPYFIAGGGHGNLGTQAYVDCYEEIKRYEKDNAIHFDYIFLASGTGTTQAGLICGQLINRDDRQIVGVSIARKNPRGKTVVLESVKEYLSAQKLNISLNEIEDKLIFIDDYIGEGYGAFSDEISLVAQEVMKKSGIPLDHTYTAKAFYGMKSFLENNGVNGKKVLFIHTGGTPLFFDSLKSREAF